MPLPAEIRKKHILTIKADAPNKPRPERMMRIATKVLFCLASVMIFTVNTGHFSGAAGICLPGALLLFPVAEFDTRPLLFADQILAFRPGL